MNKESLGTFYGVGLGPGDPELLTIKGLRILRETEVIAVPGSGRDVPLALGIAKEALGEELLSRKTVLTLGLPMTKETATLEAARECAALEIANYLDDGLDVAFITIGDPLFYSTFSYLVPLLNKALPDLTVKTVPGVTSLSASSSAVGVALTESDDTLAVIPATYGTDVLRTALSHHKTVVIMKLSGVMGKVLDLLDEMGLSEKAVLVKRATWADQEVIADISELRAGKAGYFSIMIVRT